MATQSTVRYTEGPERQMGKVITTMRISNIVDHHLAVSGRLPQDEVRSATVAGALVDTGATLLCLPTDVIVRLGLDLLREVPVVTALGPGRMRTFGSVWLEIQGRSGTFDCLELPEGSPPLLGVIPLEALGLEPDLKSQRLRLLPDSGPDNYLTV